VLVWFRITLTTFRARITAIQFVFVKVIPKLLLVPFFSGHGVVIDVSISSLAAILILPVVAGC